MNTVRVKEVYSGIISLTASTDLLTRGTHGTSIRQLTNERHLCFAWQSFLSRLVSGVKQSFHFEITTL